MFEATSKGKELDFSVLGDDHTFTVDKYVVGEAEDGVDGADADHSSLLDSSLGCKTLRLCMVFCNLCRTYRCVRV